MHDILFVLYTNVTLPSALLLLYTSVPLPYPTCTVITDIFQKPLLPGSLDKVTMEHSNDGKSEDQVEGEIDKFA